MITSFQELERHVLSHGLRGRIALANAQDEPALAALVRAQRAGAAEGTLIGPADEIARLLRRMGEQVSDYEIVPFTGTELDAAKLAVRTVREGRADMLMKGLLHTADFARAILNRETGLMPQTGRRLLSQCGFFQYDGRIVLITDARSTLTPMSRRRSGSSRTRCLWRTRWGSRRRRWRFCPRSKPCRRRCPRP